MLDAIHPRTHEHLQLGEGVLLRGVDLDAALLSGRPAANLARAMEDSDLLPLRECRLLTLGLQSGSGDHMMADIAQRLTEESELAMVRHLSRIEPALVGVACLLVGMILLAVMMPLLQIMATIG